MPLPFKLYQVKNKADQQAFVYMGKPKDDPSNGDSFYPHMVNRKCEDLYLFTTLVGSKNVKLTPSTLIPRTPDTNNEVLKDPFVHIDTRWYHFRYPGREDDIPENLPPNDFIKYHSGSRGDYTVEWRKLTSDGSVLIKPSLLSTVFWNGSKYIGDDAAGFFETTFSPKSLNDDLIYLKTRHYLEILRNTVKTDSLSIIYKKYIDECKWKSTYLMKRFRGSYCVDVKDKKTSIQVGVKSTPNKECECGCISCWEIVNGDVILKYSKLDLDIDPTNINPGDYATERINLVNLWKNYKIYTSDPDNNSPVTMTWIEQFEYNWLNNMGYNRYPEFPMVVRDEKTVNIKFNRYSDRQNRFYGINPRTATREHHAMPPVKTSDENPHIYSYTNTHSLFHPDFYMAELSGYYDRYATTPTKIITKGRIDDGKERVVVPPGVIFRTYKAVPGVISLYELDVPYRRPDEYHFAVDGYGNILGYKSLPYPAIIPTEYPVEVGGLRTASVDDAELRANIKNAWDCYFSNGKNGFCDSDTVDAIYKHRIDNNYFVLPKTINPQDKDYLTSCEIMSGSNTLTIPSYGNYTSVTIPTSAGKFVSLVGDGWNFISSEYTSGGCDITIPISGAYLISCDCSGGYSISISGDSFSLYSPQLISMDPKIRVPGDGWNFTQCTLISDSCSKIVSGTGSFITSCAMMSGDDSWYYTDSLIDNRKYFASAEVKYYPTNPQSEYKILVTGGFDKPDYILDKCELYDNTTHTWTSCASMNVRRHSHTATTLLSDISDSSSSIMDMSGSVLVVGGYNETGTLRDCELYNPVFGEWTVKASLKVKRQNHTATLLKNGSVLVVGGFYYEGICRDTYTKHYVTECELYDPATNSWKVVGNMVRGRVDHTATLLDDGNVLIYGGYDGNDFNNTYDIFDTSTSTISNSVMTLPKRRSHTAQKIIGGDVMIIGGYDENGPLKTCEWFRNYTVYTAPELNQARFGHTSVTWVQGEDDTCGMTNVISGACIHAIGGSNFVNYLSTTELYNTACGKWNYSGDTNHIRYGHTSHLINTNDGVVNTLTIGGTDGSIINEAELVSGGATHTYVNIHHCPIWIDKDIFCSYYAVEHPKKFTENEYSNECHITINCEPDICETPKPLPISSSSSTPPTSGIGVSSSSSADKVSIIVDDTTPDDATVVSSSSSSPAIDEFNEPRVPVTYQDDLMTSNDVHGFVDVKTSGSYNFKVPSGVTRIKVMVWGAGGGGGGYAHIDITNADREHSITKASGGGGGAGGHIKTIKTVTPLSTFTYVVGKGGVTGESVAIEGRSNVDGNTSWYDSNDNLISEPLLVKAIDGTNGGDSYFDTLRAYGGRGGTAGTVQKSAGLPGKGGNGSPGGTSPTLSGVDIYNGKNGKDGAYIKEGPKGPAQFGGSPGFAEGAGGGICSIPGAGEGGDGRRNNTDSAVDGQDGRVRIEW